ncbi:unnamed protein product [Blepharisma stoltei]|uniref:SPOR domain-containing protein n=1 Tax=Blepharisma stoltei TaxID=1481888 RepID=A0AAU9JYW2_9CILI|nr:unnamed protein product [Blepharisma stoltei]
MVYWHTLYKKHHSWMIRKTRGYNFFLLFLCFYSVYWYNRSSAQRTLAFLDRVRPDEKKAREDLKMWGYRRHYQPLIARSRKNALIARGDYAMRIPYEDEMKADEVLKQQGYTL